MTKLYIVFKLNLALNIDSMQCPFCGNRTTKVLETRHIDSSFVIKRKRTCPRCKKRFTTYERIEASPIVVIKRDGSREPFDREKLKRGIIEACSKRPVSLDEIEKIVADIEKDLQSYIMEISSKELGEMVLKRLKKLDKIAYIRFLSIYQNFDSIEDFIKVIKKMKRSKVGI